LLEQLANESVVFLNDLLAMTREFLCPAVSRSGLSRCLRRHVGNLRTRQPVAEEAAHPAFKSYPPG